MPSYKAICCWDSPVILFQEIHWQLKPKWKCKYYLIIVKANYIPPLTHFWIQALGNLFFFFNNYVKQVENAQIQEKYLEKQWSSVYFWKYLESILLMIYTKLQIVGLFWWNGIIINSQNCKSTRFVLIVFSLYCKKISVPMLIVCGEWCIYITVFQKNSWKMVLKVHFILMPKIPES